MTDETREAHLETEWQEGKPVSNTSSIRYLNDRGVHVVIKNLKDPTDFKRHVTYYKEIVRQGIRTPRILSIDKNTLKIKYQAIGIENDADGVWSKTLVNYEYDQNKENANIDFLVRAIQYALSEEWKDLHSGNILFHDGYLYLIDYVPGKGAHSIGSFGLQKIEDEQQRRKLVEEKFDYLLEESFNRVNDPSIDDSGLNALKQSVQLLHTY